MSYGVKANISGKTRYSKRVYKSLAGVKKSIKSPRGQAYIKKHKLKKVVPFKRRK